MNVMGIPSVVTLTEAVDFIFGCAVLRSRWVDPEKVGIVLIAVAAALLAGLLIVLTPKNICIDANALDPAGVWPAV